MYYDGPDLPDGAQMPDVEDTSIDNRGGDILSMIQVTPDGQ